MLQDQTKYLSDDYYLKMEINNQFELTIEDFYDLLIVWHFPQIKMIIGSSLVGIWKKFYVLSSCANLKTIVILRINKLNHNTM